MKSTSKVELTPPELKFLARKGLGRRLEEAVEITEGWFNTIHRLKLDDGSLVGLKIAPPRVFEPMTYERDLLKAEMEVQGYLVEKGVRGTRILTSGRDSLAGEELDWFIYQWVEGRNLGEARKTMTESAQRMADEQVAEQSARINSLVGNRFGRWHNDHCASNDWAASFSAMVEDLLNDADRKAVSLPWKRNGLRDRLAAARPAFMEVKDPRLVLWDLHDGNIIVDPTKGELQAVIDGDRALWGDPLMEYTFRSFRPLPDQWLTIYHSHFDGKGSQLDFQSRNARIRILWYDLYLSLVMMIETVFRRYPAGHDHWAREMGASALERMDALT